MLLDCIDFIGTNSYPKFFFFHLCMWMPKYKFAKFHLWNRSIFVDNMCLEW